jgi:hypothetical protein
MSAWALPSQTGTFTGKFREEKLMKLSITLALARARTLLSVSPLRDLGRARRRRYGEVLLEFSLAGEERNAAAGPWVYLRTRLDRRITRALHWKLVPRGTCEKRSLSHQVTAAAQRQRDALTRGTWPTLGQTIAGSHSVEYQAKPAVTVQTPPGVGLEARTMHAQILRGRRPQFAVSKVDCGGTFMVEVRPPAGRLDSRCEHVSPLAALGFALSLRVAPSALDRRAPAGSACKRLIGRSYQPLVVSEHFAAGRGHLDVPFSASAAGSGE